MNTFIRNALNLGLSIIMLERCKFQFIVVYSQERRNIAKQVHLLGFHVVL